MGFVIGIVLGVASGFGLIMALVYYGNIRAKRRADLVSFYLLQLQSNSTYDVFLLPKIDFLFCRCMGIC